MPVVIVSAARTPVGALQGALASVPAPRLGAVAIAEALRRADQAGAAAEVVDQVYMGQVLTAGVGQAPARQAALAAGLSVGVPAVTLNKMCGSGMEAVIQGVRAIATGDARAVVAGGMESMSGAPYLLPGARAGLRLGDAKLVDHLMHDGLIDAYDGGAMGVHAEACAREYAFGREAQDEFAVRSYRRAQQATAEGWAAREIAPVEVQGRRGAVSRVEADEGPDKVDFDKLPTLRPAFDPQGTVTAANASTINDGAAALLLADEGFARERGWTPLARVVGQAVFAKRPAEFTTAPIGAMERLFQRSGWTADQVDLFEVNEAFAVVPMAVMRHFGVEAERMNVLGGAVALGHPIGASGARIVVTLLNALALREAKRGVAAVCIGGGEALALAVERL